MIKKDSLVLVIGTALVTVAVMITGMEISKSSTRKEALTQLKSRYAQLKDEKSRIALLIETNTILAHNQPLLDFSDSSAAVDDPSKEDGDAFDWSQWWVSEGDTSSVTTSETWHIPGM